MMNYVYIPVAFLVFTAGLFGGQAYERNYGQAARANAAAIDACAREAWVYPEGCEMQAVVVKGRDLLPIPEGMAQ